MNNSIGDPICMSPPGEPDYIVPPYPNTTTNCALYHFVVAGEYYNKLVGKYSISLPDFMFLNPHVNAGYVCTQMRPSPYAASLLILATPAARTCGKTRPIVSRPSAPLTSTWGIPTTCLGQPMPPFPMAASLGLDQLANW